MVTPQKLNRYISGGNPRNRSRRLVETQSSLPSHFFPFYKRRAAHISVRRRRGSVRRETGVCPGCESRRRWRTLHDVRKTSGPARACATIRGRSFARVYPRDLTRDGQDLWTIPPEGTSGGYRKYRTVDLPTRSKARELTGSKLLSPTASATSPLPPT